jgi:hypothetical protein
VQNRPPPDVDEFADADGTPDPGDESGRSGGGDGEEEAEALTVHRKRGGCAGCAAGAGGGGAWAAGLILAGILIAITRRRPRR